MQVSLTYTKPFYRGGTAVLRSGVPVYAYQEKKVAVTDDFGTTQTSYEQRLVQLPYITLSGTPVVELPLVEENYRAIKHLVFNSKSFRFTDSTSAQFWARFEESMAPTPVKEKVAPEAVVKAPVEAATEAEAPAIFTAPKPKTKAQRTKETMGEAEL